MGLDTFAYKKVHIDDNDEDGKLFEGISLCGGMFSGNGAGSFRGKVYAGVLKEYTGLDLYQEDISPKQLREWYYGLTMYQLEDLKENCGEAEDLLKFFKVCIDNGFGLHGWW